MPSFLTKFDKIYSENRGMVEEVTVVLVAVSELAQRRTTTIALRVTNTLNLFSIQLLESGEFWKHL